jgi:HEAT repeat protein
VRGFYADALAQIGGSRAVAALIAALSDPEEHVVQHACSGLSCLEDPQAIDPILRLLDHPSWSVRREACSALIELGITDSRVISALEGMLQEPVPEREAIWRDTLNWQLARLRGTFEEEKQRAVETAMSELDDPDPKVRQRAVRELQGVRDPRVVEALIAAMDDPAPGVRCGAALCLGMLEVPVALPVLIEHLLRDESVRVRQYCTLKLSRFHDERAVDALIQALSDPDETIPRTAINQLATLGDPRAIPHLLRFLSHPDWKVRRNTARALIELRSTDPRVAETLEQLAREPEAEEHDLEAEEWNCNLESYQRMAQEGVGPEPPGPFPKLCDLLEQARQLAAGAEG